MKVYMLSVTIIPHVWEVKYSGATVGPTAVFIIPRRSNTCSRVVKGQKLIISCSLSSINCTLSSRQDAIVRCRRETVDEAEVESAEFQMRREP